MCGRYSTGTEVENIRFREIINEANANIIGDKLIIPRSDGDIYPGDLAPVAYTKSSIVQYTAMNWGFKYNGRLIINARSETADIKPMFSHSLNYMRCLVPAAGYYEWNSRNEKFFFADPNGEMLNLAGLFRYNTAGLPEFTILTRDAFGTYADIHSRMPLIIYEHDAWLNDTSAAKKLLNSGSDIKLDVICQSSQQLSMF